MKQLSFMQTCIKKNIMKNVMPIKYENLGQMDKFLEKCNLLTMTQEDTENLTSPINNKEYISLAEILSLYWFINKYYQIPEEEIIPVINSNNQMHPTRKFSIL